MGKHGAYPYALYRKIYDRLLTLQFYNIRHYHNAFRYFHIEARFNLARISSLRSKKDGSAASLG